jgi:hypothetical protein
MWLTLYLGLHCSCIVERHCTPVSTCWNPAVLQARPRKISPSSALCHSWHWGAGCPVRSGIHLTELLINSSVPGIWTSPNKYCRIVFFWALNFCLLFRHRAEQSSRIALLDYTGHSSLDPSLPGPKEAHFWWVGYWLQRTSAWNTASQHLFSVKFYIMFREILETIRNFKGTNKYILKIWTKQTCLYFLFRLL